MSTDGWSANGFAELVRPQVATNYTLPNTHTLRSAHFRPAKVEWVGLHVVEGYKFNVRINFYVRQKLQSIRNIICQAVS